LTGLLKNGAEARILFAENNGRCGGIAAPGKQNSVNNGQSAGGREQVAKKTDGKKRRNDSEGHKVNWQSAR
jgi:hypothetical protein